MSNGKMCCSKHYNSCPSIRKKNSEGLKKVYEEDRKDLSHFDGKRGWSKNKILKSKSEIFETNTTFSSGYVKKAFIHYTENNSCDKCGLKDTWNGKPITLELDHIDGDNTNNSLDNLRLLCPNCHSQTENFRGKNINTGSKKVSDVELIESLRESKNIRQALLKVGLAAKGGNYDRCNRLIQENDIQM